MEVAKRKRKFRKMRNVHTGEVIDIPQFSPLEEKLILIKVFANGALEDEVDQVDYLRRIHELSA